MNTVYSRFGLSLFSLMCFSLVQFSFAKAPEIEAVHSSAIVQEMPFLEGDIPCTVPATIPQELDDIFTKALENIPCHLVQSLQRVEIFVDDEGVYPRAMANARIIKVRKDAIDDIEIVSVIRHELGHVVDLGGLVSSTYETESIFKDGKKVFYEDDLSVQFYNISWTEYGKKYDATRLDFVSGYAKYDMFEDFSEGFLMYMEQGRYFKAMAMQNDVLKKKYLFFKEHVFYGLEFETGEIPMNLLVREWDTTKI